MFNKERTLNLYAGNNMALLRKISFPMIEKIGGISQSDHDDFYSIANNTLNYCVENYDESKNNNFEAYLRESIARKFKTEMTRRNRIRRIKSSNIDHIDTKVGDGDSTIGDMIDSGFRVEDEIEELALEENVINYLNSLSQKQREIAILIIKDYDFDQIREKLGMSENKFKLALAKMKSFERKLILQNKN